MQQRIKVAVIAAAAGAALATSVAKSAGPRGELPKGDETVHLDPADFTTEIDNRYWPMKPGSRWVYRETDSEGTRQKVVVNGQAQDQADRQRDHGQGRPRQGHRERRARRAHRRLVRAGPGRQHLVSR